MEVKLKELKLNILEDQFPFFTDEQLRQLLKANGGDVRKASYKACLQKAQNTSFSVSGLSIESNHDFWIRLASMYTPIRTKGLQRGD